MADLVHYRLADGIATITLDDGKRNALSPEMFRQIYAALDRAEADRAVVILTGKEQVFSAGFDLKVMRGAPLEALRMLRAGYALTARVLAYPYPVIAACNGHALAMGVFLMLSADYVIGTRGEFRISANEVAIGMMMPRVAAAMQRNVHLYIALPMHSLKLCTVDGFSSAQMAHLRGCSHEWVQFIWT